MHQVEDRQTLVHIARRNRRKIKCVWAVNVCVPQSYKHPHSLDDIQKFVSSSDTRIRLRKVEDGIRHENFSNPQHMLVTGKSLNIRFYRIAHGRELSPEQCYNHWRGHGSMFTEAQTLALLLHCLVDGQIQFEDLPQGTGLVPPSERFSPENAFQSAPYLWVGADYSCELRSLDLVPLDENRVLIVVESVSTR